MASVTHQNTLPDSANKTDFYALIDNSSVTQIVNEDIAASAAIAYSKLSLSGMIALKDLSAVIPQIVFNDNEIVSYQNEMVTST